MLVYYLFSVLVDTFGKERESFVSCSHQHDGVRYSHQTTRVKSTEDGVQRHVAAPEGGLGGGPGSASLQHQEVLWTGRLYTYGPRCFQWKLIL